MTENSPKRSVGRPKTITDMRKYKASKAREYRARNKSDKSTVPKPYSPMDREGI